MGGGGLKGGDKIQYYTNYTKPYTNNLILIYYRFQLLKDQALFNKIYQHAPQVYVEIWTREFFFNIVSSVRFFLLH